MDSMQTNTARFDVAIVGAGIVGASIAWWLTRLQPGLSVALIERDAGFEWASSQRSASSIRQQFSIPVNIEMSRFGLEFLSEAESLLSVDGESPAIGLTLPGYLYLASEAQAAGLRAQNAIQRAQGAAIDLLTPTELSARFPWLQTDDLALGAFGGGCEGWFDGPALHAAMVRSARAQGAQLIKAEAKGFAHSGSGKLARVSGVQLNDGRVIECGLAVNATGAWSRHLVASLGISLPVHARRRTVFVLSCPTPLPDCPLIIDPSGFWFRPEGRQFIFGTTPDPDTDDLPLEPNLMEFDEHTWAALAQRVPAFESVRVERAWAGYYEMNLFDHNALIGPWPGIEGLLIATGFSGHGMQQAPAAGRGIAELILNGRYTTLDLSALSPARLHSGQALIEANVIG
jgi:glycine/D-amino acid oxidase-like deaminating enzyme